MIKMISNDFKELESFAISNEMYELVKEKTRDDYPYPLTKKEFPDIDYEELIKNRFEHLKNWINKENNK